MGILEDVRMNYRCMEVHCSRQLLSLVKLIEMNQCYFFNCLWIGDFGNWVEMNSKQYSLEQKNGCLLCFRNAFAYIVIKEFVNCWVQFLLICIVLIKSNFKKWPTHLWINLNSFCDCKLCIYFRLSIVLNWRNKITNCCSI